MIPDLDQLADEAINARTVHMLSGAAMDSEDAEIARRALRAAEWRHTHPGLDALADTRLTRLARLEAQGVTPDPGCTATSGPVTLDAVQDIPPLGHRYVIVRNQDIVGTAWLSTDPDTRGLYEAVPHDGRGGARGASLAEALHRLAARLDRDELVQRAARRGDVQ